MSGIMTGEQAQRAICAGRDATIRDKARNDAFEDAASEIERLAQESVCGYGSRCAAEGTSNAHRYDAYMNAVRVILAMRD